MTWNFIDPTTCGHPLPSPIVRAERYWVFIISKEMIGTSWDVHLYFDVMQQSHYRITFTESQDDTESFIGTLSYEFILQIEG